MLFLLGTGVFLKQISTYYNVNLTENLFGYLELLGVIGLIMIVLEAAVDLKITKDKIPLVRKSILMALLVLLITSLAMGSAIMFLLDEPFFNSLIYAIPLSVVSSAVLIPSVHSLTQQKKEFLIYESTFSDIIGIMFFNFIVLQEESILNIGGILNIIFTIIQSVLISYLLVYIFSKFKTGVRIFLIIAILAILYAVGKKLHLSSLLLIFIFGLFLNNTKLFFFNKLQGYIDHGAVKKLVKDFHLITAETAFVVRTLFFVAFGMMIDLNQLLDPKVIIVGSVIIVILYSVRYLNFKMFLKTDVFPEIFLAPRGLITILLFFQIPAVYEIRGLGMGVLFFVILATGLIMMMGLMFSKDSIIDEFTVIDFGLGPSSDNANVDKISKFSEYDDL